MVDGIKQGRVSFKKWVGRHSTKTERRGKITVIGKIYF
jgi:hypothetical protein